MTADRDYPRDAQAAYDAVAVGDVIEDTHGNVGRVKRKTTDSAGRLAVATTHGRHGKIVRADMLYTYTNTLS